jgi:hypothetical protein
MCGNVRRHARAASLFLVGRHTGPLDTNHRPDSSFFSSIIIGRRELIEGAVFSSCEAFVCRFWTGARRLRIFSRHYFAYATEGAVADTAGSFMLTRRFTTWVIVLPRFPSKPNQSVFWIQSLCI